jgi:hypothetical protein
MVQIAIVPLALRVRAWNTNWLPSGDHEGRPSSAAESVNLVKPVPSRACGDPAGGSS